MLRVNVRTSCSSLVTRGGGETVPFILRAETLGGGIVDKTDTQLDNGWWLRGAVVPFRQFSVRGIALYIGVASKERTLGMTVSSSEVVYGRESRVVSALDERLGIPRPRRRGKVSETRPCAVIGEIDVVDGWWPDLRGSVVVELVGGQGADESDACPRRMRRRLRISCHESEACRGGGWKARGRRTG